MQESLSLCLALSMKQFLLIAYRAASTIMFNRMYSKINEKLINAYVCTDASDIRFSEISIICTSKLNIHSCVLNQIEPISSAH